MLMISTLNIDTHNEHQTTTECPLLPSNGKMQFLFQNCLVRATS